MVSENVLNIDEDDFSTRASVKSIKNLNKINKISFKEINYAYVTQLLSTLEEKYQHQRLPPHLLRYLISASQSQLGRRNGNEVM